MGLLGGGEESLTSVGSSSATGWGLPPPNSSSSSSAWGSGNSSGQVATSSSGWGSNSASSQRSGGNGNGLGQMSEQNNASHSHSISNTNINTNSSISTSPKLINSWAQAAGKGLNNGPSHDLGAVNANNGFSSSNNPDNVNSNVNNKCRNDIGQMVEMKEAFISDNWGHAVINQDNAWNLDSSPQSSPKENTSVWKSTTSTNGTEIWENTVRHKSKGPTTGCAPAVASNASAQASWSNTHTPTTHIGGTWGEEEDPSSHWTGVPHGQHNQSQNHNNSVSARPIERENGMEQRRQMNMGMNMNMSMNMESGNGNGNGSASSGMNNMNPNIGSGRQMMNSGNNNNKSNWNMNSMSNNDSQQQQPPQRPRMNQSAWDEACDQNDEPDGTWNNHHNNNSHNSAHSNHSNNSNNSNGNGKSSESFGTWSPVPNPKRDKSSWDSDTKSGGFDDGTAVWGNPGRQQKVSNNWVKSDSPPSAKSSHSMNHSMNSANNGMNNVSQQHQQPMNLSGMPSSPGNRTFSNEIGSHRDSLSSGSGGSGWCDGDQTKSVPVTPNTPSGWTDSNASPMPYWAKPKPATAPSWSDGQIDTSSWCGPKQGKPLTKDIIYASKQFRILAEMGYKRDDIENALRNANMNVDEALVELKAISVRESNNALDIDVVGRFKGSGLNSNTPSLLSNTTGLANSSLASINNRNPSLISILQQPQQQSGQNHSISQANQVQSALTANQSNRIGNAQPTHNATQLKLLVQQIQLAVQAGHLNAQILNQPLAPSTLQLLYQLLQQIKNLHQLQVGATNHFPKGSSNTSVPLNQPSINVQITQTKQNIVNLQNQIAAQQAIYLKQQQTPKASQQQPQQSHMTQQHANSLLNASNSSHGALHLNASQSSSDFFKTASGIDNNALTSDRDLSSQMMSRFQTTWKTPYNKEDENHVNVNLAASLQSEFSRAPGPPVAKPQQAQSGMTLMSRSESINWAGLSGDDSSWPDSLVTSSSTNQDMKDLVSSNSQSQSSLVNQAYNLTDLVPEFEPGKPWKGTSKNIEDDPTITPGSVNLSRSPLSVSVNTIKDPNNILLNWPSSKLSPGASAGASQIPSTDSLATLPLPLSSSTWAFTPPSNTSIFGNSAISNENKPGVKAATGGWNSMNSSGGETNMNQQCNVNDMWSNNTAKPRGPPPGLAPHLKNPTNTNANSSSSNIWNTDNRPSSLALSDRASLGSAFLLLRNLTPQIDGSTLKTLCVQHGPLQSFHLFLNHGIALVRYSTREEAAKAQSALNNCVLGNTTILADIPQESEVQQYLQLLGQHSNWSNNGQNGVVGSSNGVVPSTSGGTNFRTGNANTLQYTGNSGMSGVSQVQSKMDQTVSSSQQQQHQAVSVSSPSWSSSSPAASLNLWSFSNSGNNNLWGSPSLNAQDGSNSSIQSLLPGDLLGGETN